MGVRETKVRKCQKITRNFFHPWWKIEKLQNDRKKLEIHSDVSNNAL